MRSRCTYEKHRAWLRYGGRGIKVCDRWLNDYDAFFEDMGECPEGMTIERQDNDGHYELGNCRWASRKEQARNRHGNRIIELGSRKQTVTDWAEEIGLSPSGINYRQNAGLPISEVLSPERRRLEEAPHGSVSRYTNRKCRCDLCREAWRDYTSQRRLKQREHS
jgi:hypothetical protein